MAEIRKLKDGELTVYPQTVGTAVILEDGTTVQDLADEFADFDPNVLKTAPTLTKRRNNYIIDHPYIDKPGAEIVLLRYNKKIHKKQPDPDSPGLYLHPYKKGWCVAVGPSHAGAYFTFSKYTSCYSLETFFDDNNLLVTASRHFGIALRIPNPEWTRPATRHKNAIYKGIPESLWSDVLSVNVHSNNHHFNGVGILR